MKYKLKADLVNKLANGKICLHNNIKDMPMIQQVIMDAFGDIEGLRGTSEYYYSSGEKDKWYSSDFQPDSLEPVKLSDFLEKEERRIVGYLVSPLYEGAANSLLRARKRIILTSINQNGVEVSFLPDSEMHAFFRSENLMHWFAPIYEEAKEEVKTETFTPTPYEGLKLQAIEIIIANKLNADKLQLFINEHIGF